MNNLIKIKIVNNCMYKNKEKYRAKSNNLNILTRMKGNLKDNNK